MHKQFKFVLLMISSSYVVLGDEISDERITCKHLKDSFTNSNCCNMEDTKPAFCPENCMNLGSSSPHTCCSNLRMNVTEYDGSITSYNLTKYLRKKRYPFGGGDGGIPPPPYQ